MHDAAKPSTLTVTFLAAIHKRVIDKPANTSPLRPARTTVTARMLLEFVRRVGILSPPPGTLAIVFFQV